VGLEVCATIASKPDTRHMNVPRRLVMAITERVKVMARETAKEVDFKESVTIAVG
jgi:hypothetical protein